MSVSSNMELRHLPIQHTSKLSQILDRNESWKSLMEKIPRNLADIQNVADSNKISRKYSAEDIHQIDLSSKERKHSPTLILFDEWGTSGRKRATVSDLLSLLVKVELFRAADFVAMDILNAPPPKRPKTGPAARVDISLPADQLDEQAIEEILNNAIYPNSSRLNADIGSEIKNKNRDFRNGINVDRVKSINIFTSSGEIISETESEFESDSHSDLIEFSAKTVTNAINSNNMETATEAASIHPSDQSVFTSQPSMVTNESFNLPANLPYAQSDKQPNTQSTFSMSAIDMESNPAHSSDSSESYTESSDNSASDSLIPDISNLLIRDESNSTCMFSSTNNDDSVSTKPPTASVYIPDLSLLNDS